LVVFATFLGIRMYNINGRSYYKYRILCEGEVVLAYYYARGPRDAIETYLLAIGEDTGGLRLETIKSPTTGNACQAVHINCFGHVRAEIVPKDKGFSVDEEREQQYARRGGFRPCFLMYLVLL